MTDAPAPADVSLSRPLGTETTRHPAFRRDNAETASETPGLKALALLVLSRDGRPDTERDKVSRPTRPIDTSAETVGAGEAAPARWTDAEEERAAIADHDGNIPRAWAEGFARLHPDRPPGDVPLKRWQTFVDDCGRFLDAGWAEKAAVLGWGPLDLFGCDRELPFARVDQAGVLWLLSGGKLIALTEATAAIERQTGARQTYRRKPRELGRVLVWELAS